MFREVGVGVVAHLQIITTQAGHILHNDGGHIAHFNVLQQLLEAGPAEVCAGVAIVHIKTGVG